MAAQELGEPAPAIVDEACLEEVLMRHQLDRTLTQSQKLTDFRT